MDAFQWLSLLLLLAVAGWVLVVVVVHLRRASKQRARNTRNSRAVDDIFRHDRARDVMRGWINRDN